ncbi:Nucleoporin nup84 [Tieghemiomyces parasiticus]|uniref:Nuclear pore complex protein n=1 Tax=Tieghemiomyces parasiticus TaxID=78921 RepID=A0A9W8A2K7_9FUNG|nr:Nucleoporin nup84 [Tieghemiomyces parasiticus]
MAGHPEVIDKFAQAYERAQDGLTIREDAGLALIFRDICDEQWDTVRQSGDQDHFFRPNRRLPPGTTGQTETMWRAECTTWDLIHRLYLERLTGGNDESAPSEAGVRPLATDHQLVEELFERDSQLREVNLVRMWLEQIAPQFDPAPPRSGYWVYTRGELQQQQRAQPAALPRQFAPGADPGSPFALNRPNPLGNMLNKPRAPGVPAGGNGGGGADTLRAAATLAAGNARVAAARVTSLDPDAPIREHKALHIEDETYERDLVATLFRYIRRGQVDEAAALCDASGMAWRSASIRGGLFFRDSQLETPAEQADLMESDMDPDLSSSPAPVVVGTLHRTLWKRACLTLARDTALSATERALYAALTGCLDHVLPACETWEDYLWAYYTAIVEGRVDQCLARRSVQVVLNEGAPDTPVDPKWDLATLLSPTGPLTPPPSEPDLAGRGDDNDLAPATVFDRMAHARNDTVATEASTDPYRRIQSLIILGRLDELLDEFARQVHPHYDTQLEPAVLAYGRAGLDPATGDGRSTPAPATDAEMEIGQGLSLIEPDPAAPRRVAFATDSTTGGDAHPELALVDAPVQPDILRLVAHLTLYLRAHGVTIPNLAGDAIIYRFVRYLIQLVHGRPTPARVDSSVFGTTSAPPVGRHSLGHQSLMAQFNRARRPTDIFGLSEATKDTGSGGSLLADEGPSSAAEWVALYTARLPLAWQVPVYAQYLVGITAPFEPQRQHALRRATTAGLPVRPCARLAADTILNGALARDDPAARQLLGSGLIGSRDSRRLTGVHDPVSDEDRWLIRALEWLGYDPELYLLLLLRCNTLARYFLTRGRLHACRALLHAVPDDLIRRGWVEAVQRLDEGENLGLDPVDDAEGEESGADALSAAETFDWQLGWDERAEREEAQDTDQDLSVSESSFWLASSSTAHPRDADARIRKRRRELIQGVQEFYHYRNLIECFTAFEEWAESMARKPLHAAPGNTEGVGVPPAATTDAPATRSRKARASVVQRTQATRFTEWAESFRGLTKRTTDHFRHVLESDWLSDSLHSNGVTLAAERRNAELETLRAFYIPEVTCRLHAILYQSRVVVPENLNLSLELSQLVASEDHRLYREFMKAERLPELMDLFARSAMAILETGSTSAFRTTVQ